MLATNELEKVRMRHAKLPEGGRKMWREVGGPPTKATRDGIGACSVTDMYYFLMDGADEQGEDERTGI
jgi:hypothetical protein